MHGIEDPLAVLGLDPIGGGIIGDFEQLVGTLLISEPPRVGALTLYHHLHLVRCRIASGFRSSPDSCARVIWLMILEDGRFINEICEGLVPALQRRGLVREAYTQPILRQTLREF